jgi:hypothetical protein
MIYEELLDVTGFKGFEARLLLGVAQIPVPEASESLEGHPRAHAILATAWIMKRTAGLSNTQLQQLVLEVSKHITDDILKEPSNPLQTVRLADQRWLFCWDSRVIDLVSGDVVAQPDNLSPVMRSIYDVRNCIQASTRVRRQASV